jgi:hypothetical protein
MEAAATTPSDMRALATTIDEFFTSHVRVIDVQDLDEGNRECSICLNAFQMHDDQEPTTDKDTTDIPEAAIHVVHCGHVFGRTCLYKHTTSFLPISLRCPLCRTELLYPVAADRYLLMKLREILEIINGRLDSLKSSLHSLQNAMREFEGLAGVDEASIDLVMNVQRFTEDFLANRQVKRTLALVAIALVEDSIRAWERRATAHTVA